MKNHSSVCPDNPDEYRCVKGIYEKISGWNEQTETETGTGKTGCQNRKSTGKGQRKRKKTTGDEKASWKADDKATDRTGSAAYEYPDHRSKYQVF